MRRGSTSITRKSSFLQHAEQGYPVHAGGLHHHGLYTALLQPIGQAVQVRGESLKTPAPAASARSADTATKMAAGSPRQSPPRSGSPETNSAGRRSRSTPVRPCPLISRSSDLSSSYPLQHRSVGASPEGATNCSHSPERDRLHRGVTNDAAVGLPDHALRRADEHQCPSRSWSGRRTSSTPYTRVPASSVSLPLYGPDPGVTLLYAFLEK